MRELFLRILRRSAVMVPILIAIGLVFSYAFQTAAEVMANVKFDEESLATMRFRWPLVTTILGVVVLLLMEVGMYVVRGNPKPKPKPGEGAIKEGIPQTPMAPGGGK